VSDGSFHELIILKTVLYMLTDTLALLETAIHELKRSMHAERDSTSRIDENGSSNASSCAMDVSLEFRTREQVWIAQSQVSGLTYYCRMTIAMRKG
jgi:hypothetical protein